MKVAIVSSGNPCDMKGIMNYVQTKCYYLNKNAGNIEFEYYLIIQNYSILFQFLLMLMGKLGKFTCNTRQNKTYKCDDVVYRCLYVSYGILDNIITTKLRKRFLSFRYKLMYFRHFRDVDVISSHTLVAHELALFVHEKRGTPFITTWHGSDVHVVPEQTPQFKPVIKKIMESSFKNFFVSKYLMNLSDEITRKASKDVIYTGVADYFYLYEEQKRLQLKEQLGVTNKKVVVFAGNLIPLKNVMLLPQIFQKIYNGFSANNTIIWIIGDGELAKPLKDSLDSLKLPYKMFGNVKPEHMPDYYNCADLLLLISKKEGLGLVSIEAMQCGCYVLGSDVGGIKEVIGQENVFDLSDNFVEKISTKAVKVLSEDRKPQPLNPCFSWDKAVKTEIDLLKSLK